MKNKELVIQKAHKGNAVLFINRADDTCKTKSILKNTSKFEKI